MTVHRFWLRVHQYTGLIASLFLVVVALTGTVLAFEPDYDRWFNPALWHVDRGAQAGPRLGEQTLADRVQATFGDSASGVRVAQINIAADARLVQVFELTNGMRVYVDPYTGRITGARRGQTRLERFLFQVRVLHTRLFIGERGRDVVDIVSALLVVLIVPVGIYLWLNRKRATVAWRASWKRVNWDLHSAVGIYAAVFVLMLAATGVFIGYEPALYWLTRSNPEPSPRLPRSVLPAARADAARITLDRAIMAADSALASSARNPANLPAARQVILPLRAQSVFQVSESNARLGRSLVAVDRYSGRVLLVDDYSNAPAALRAHTVDQAVHLGTIGGLGTAVVAAVSGLALIVIVMTGTVIWWRKLEL